VWKQPRSQGLSLEDGRGGKPTFKGKALGTRLVWKMPKNSFPHANDTISPSSWRVVTTTTATSLFSQE